MALTNATRLADFGSEISGVIQVDNINERIGIGTTNSQELLQVGTGVTVYGNSGIVSATNFYGSAKNLTGVAATDYIVSNSLKVLGISTFIGDVSIGETLTYEDVTNIDSLGIITARTGVKVTSGGINAAGVVTATSFSGDGSNLTGVESGVVNFVASGNIDNGATVIIKDDGTVAGVATVSVGTTHGTGTEYLGVTASNNVVVYDTAQEKIVIFSKISGKSQAVVGTVSGTSITFGTPVDSYGSTPSYHDACYDVNSGKIVYCYRADGDSDVGRVRIGTVSGDTITFGSELTYDSGLNGWPKIAYDANAQKFVIVWSQGSSYAGKAIVGTVIGESATFGSVADLATKPYGKDIVYDASAQKVVAYYKDNNDSNKGKAKVGTVTGTDISFASAAEFESGQVATSHIVASYDSVNQKTVVAYIDEDDNNYGKANVGTVTGTGITFATEQTFNAASTQHLASAYDATVEKTIIVYNSASDGFLREATLDGTTIEYESAYMWTSNSEEYPGMEYDPDQGVVVIGYANAQDSNHGYAQVVKLGSVQTNMTTENYIGIAGEAIANGATGKVNVIGGTNTGQSGLTTAQTYYVGQSGILTTTADTPSVVAGTSISSTKIKVR